MTDITADDEREAREWLKRRANGDEPAWADHARTILALLDRPRMPRPEEVPAKVIDKMWMDAAAHGGGKHGMEIALGVHYDHYNPPPAPKKVEAWGIVAPNGEIIHVRQTEDAARQRAKYCPDDVRIVHLVEADHD